MHVENVIYQGTYSVLFQGHHPDGGAHAKFTNYKFNKDEFLRLVNIAAEHVRNHPKFPARVYHDEL